MMTKYSESEIADMDLTKAMDPVMLDVANMMLAANKYDGNIKLIDAMLPYFCIASDDSVKAHMMTVLNTLFAELSQYATQMMRCDSAILQSIDSVVDEKVLRPTMTLRGIIKIVYDASGDEDSRVALGALDGMLNILYAKMINVGDLDATYAVISGQKPC